MFVMKKFICVCYYWVGEMNSNNINWIALVILKVSIRNFILVIMMMSLMFIFFLCSYFFPVIMMVCFDIWVFLVYFEKKTTTCLILVTNLMTIFIFVSYYFSIFFSFSIFQVTNMMTVTMMMMMANTEIIRWSNSNLEIIFIIETR